MEKVEYLYHVLYQGLYMLVINLPCTFKKGNLMIKTIYQDK